MVSYSSNRGYAMPSTGSSADTDAWGGELNTTFLQSVDVHLGGTLNLYSSTVGTTYTLSSAEAMVGNIVISSTATFNLRWPSPGYTSGIYRVEPSSNFGATSSAGSGSVSLSAATPRLISITSGVAEFADVPPTTVSSRPGPPGPSGPTGPLGPPTSPQSYANVAGGLTYAFTSPGDPGGTTATTFKMMGLGCTVTTSTLSGRMFAEFMFDVTNTSSNEAVTVQMYYGTGTAPSNGAAATGTTLGSNKQHNMGWTSARQASVCGGILPTAVTTTYWFDLAIKTGTGAGTGTIHNIDFMAQEY